jgi:cytochrome P450
MSANTPKAAAKSPAFGGSGEYRGGFSSIVFKGRLLAYGAFCYFLSHLGPLRFIFDLLRAVRPVWLFGGTLVVTRASEVREVLERFDDFFLGEFIEAGMPWGPFIMTIDWREQHARERGLLQQAVNSSADIEFIRQITKAVASSSVNRARGRLDLVTELAEPVMVEIFKEYFGIPPVGSPREMAQVMRNLAGIIMVGPPASHARIFASWGWTSSDLG